MPELIEDAAPYVALACAVLAVAVMALAGWHAWRRWRRARDTQRAAVALLDVHQGRLDAAIQLASERTGVLADDGDELAASLGELRADAAHLRWMLGRIPGEGERLREELLDLVLPTSPGRRDA